MKRKETEGNGRKIGPRNLSPPRTETGVPALLKSRGRFLILVLPLLPRAAIKVHHYITRHYVVHLRLARPSWRTSLSLATSAGARLAAPAGRAGPGPGGPPAEAPALPRGVGAAEVRPRGCAASTIEGTIIWCTIICRLSSAPLNGAPLLRKHHGAQRNGLELLDLSSSCRRSLAAMVPTTYFEELDAPPHLPGQF